MVRLLLPDSKTLKSVNRGTLGELHQHQDYIEMEGSIVKKRVV